MLKRNKKVKIPVTKSVHEEAAHLANHPHHIGMGKNIAVQVGAGIAAGVGTYQINRKLAKKQGDSIAPPSPVTGGMPSNTGENVSKFASKAHKKVRGGQ